MGASGEQLVGFQKLVAILVGVWLLLGSLPVFAKMFGYDFLPSIEWAAKSNDPGLAAGLISAVLVLWLVLKRLHRVQGGDAKKAGAVLISPLLSYFLGKATVVIVVPMMLALIAGHRVELTFIVERADRGGSRRCFSPLEFQGLPWFFDRICGAPDDFRHGLAHGKRIVVIGHGTSLGIFAQRLRQVE
jgi:hypothetical protein